MSESFRCTANSCSSSQLLTASCEVFTLHFSSYNTMSFSSSFLKAVDHSSMMCDVTHAFLLALHSTGSFRMSRFRKHHGFAALLITKGFSVSPDIKPHRNTVNLSLHSFPPEHFSP